MIVTRDDALAERLRLLRAHGARIRDHHEILGTNSRLDALQAAVLIVKLQWLERYTEARRRHAHAYNEGLRSSACVCPVERPGGRHIYNQYAVRIADRDRVRAALKERGIDTGVYYPVPLHRQEVFLPLGYDEGRFPHAEEAARSTLCLPIYPELPESDRKQVVSSLVELVGSKQST